MVVTTAYTSANTNPAPGNTTYLPPTLPALAAATITSSQVDVFDPLGRAQQYFGSFDLISLAAGNYSTSTFTGFKQYSTSLASPATLSLEVSGASVNGAAILQFISTNNAPGLVNTLLDGADQITGSLEADTLSGFAGSDFIKGLDGADALSGDIGDDTMNGNVGNDTVRGAVGNDVVRGGKDNDQLYGDDGNDRLIGGLGNDTSIGGLGADTFVLSPGQDLVTDFNAAENDTIEILASTAYTLGSNGPDGSGDLTITYSEGVTVFVGVSLDGFNEATSIVLI